MKTFKIARVTTPILLSLVFCVPGCKDDEADGDADGDSDSSSSEGTGTAPDVEDSEETTAYDLPSGGTAVVTFEYNHDSGQPADSDLTVATDTTGVLFQVFTNDDSPYLSAGLAIREIRADVTYELKISDDKLVLRNIEADKTVFSQAVDFGDATEFQVTVPSEDVFAAPVDVIDTTIY
jgi:hypothetical protein